MKLRIQTLLNELNRGVYEKEPELALSLLAALAGQSILLLGPPGVAKSMVARRLKLAFRDARSFEYLMSRFSTPDEIFGPVSIARLKSSDRYERAVDGYLPTADVVFLDEIWKAGPAIQNTLLTVINEKTYLNGAQPMRLPLKLLIGASNELPQEGEGLEALWDRFIIRVVSGSIQDEALFRRMLLDESTGDESTTDPSDSLFASSAGQPVVSEPISAEEYARWQDEMRRIEVPTTVLEAITLIRRALSDVEVEGQDVHRNIYVSDRRWKQIVCLLRASAYVHDRKEVSLNDLQVAVHCLWNEPDEISAIGRIVSRAILAQSLDKLDQLVLSVRYGLQARQVREALEEARLQGDHRDDDLIVFDHFYYGIDPKAGRDIYIYVTDFRRLPTRTADEASVKGVMYKDPQVPERTVIRAFTNPDNIGQVGAELTRVNLYRDSNNLYVNGVRYPLRRTLRGGQTAQESGLETDSVKAAFAQRDYEKEVDDLFVSTTMLFNQMKSHLFVPRSAQEAMQTQMESFRRQIALLRADVRRLVYDE